MDKCNLTHRRANVAKVNVVSGDISKVKSDALITAINSGGMWWGGIDGVINRCAGGLFHNQAAQQMPLKHGQAVNAKGDASNRASFANVVFVIDDLEGPLGDIIFNGLKGASDGAYRSVTLPAIRMGVMLGAVEKTTTEAIQQMVDGVRRFVAENPHTSVKDITFVVYQDDTLVSALKAGFQVN